MKQDSYYLKGFSDYPDNFHYPHRDSHTAAQERAYLKGWHERRLIVQEQLEIELLD